MKRFWSWSLSAHRWEFIYEATERDTDDESDSESDNEADELE